MDWPRAAGGWTDVRSIGGKDDGKETKGKAKDRNVGGVEVGLV